jgi:hypothetical protein
VRWSEKPQSCGTATSAIATMRLQQACDCGMAVLVAEKPQQRRRKKDSPR